MLTYESYDSTIAQGLAQSDVASVCEWRDHQAFLAAQIFKRIRELDVTHRDDTCGRPVVVLGVGPPVEPSLF